ncbi:hypothetical protein QEJ31_11860 [Pigmentibacter sp. JX0631]|uniref:hypothetical protein n=1 Tax=Pigmentibacter sp. JX0631 TaxID=2976982 RepID=UPI002468D46D|nr:hypothetical protein [Pigmentibacter sp. JX0631]WGL59217.1 hypothetical protein QEJ31_11860 [Pigmentibacter sp. JX0631]
MLINLIICIALAIPLIFFIIYPLLSNYGNTNILKRNFTFQTENELNNILILRNALFQKLVYGRSELKDIELLSEAEIYQSLLAICAKLEDEELPKFPTEVKNPVNNQEEGNIKKDFLYSLVILLGVLFIVFNFLSSSAFALGDQKNENIPTDVVIPPPTILDKSGYWLPAVNQYILMPAMGEVKVYYVGMFTNTFHAKGTQLLLPFPQGFTDLKILGAQNATLEKNGGQESPVLNLELSEGVNQISAEFSLPASQGIAKWQAANLQTLPGVTIIMMPEHNAALRNLLSNFFRTPNVWPPRLENISTQFRSILGPDPLDLSNSKLKDPNQLSRQLVRVGDKSADFPSFEIYGVIPSRAYIYLTILFFAFFLFTVTAISIFKTSK